MCDCWDFGITTKLQEAENSERSNFGSSKLKSDTIIEIMLHNHALQFICIV